MPLAALLSELIKTVLLQQEGQAASVSGELAAAMQEERCMQRDKQGNALLKSVCNEHKL